MMLSSIGRRNCVAIVRLVRNASCNRSYRSVICLLSANNTQLRLSSSATNVDKHEFKAETKSLLDIVAKSLYSEKEVFLRELISNASDSLEKRKFFDATNGDKDAEFEPYEIKIETGAKSLIIQDTGVGMDKNELINLLGTIARSGSREFKDKDELESGNSIIGQFGVGFYSALMVADKVTVTTRKNGLDSVGYKWTWDGSSLYEIAEDDSAKPGCRIELNLRSDAEHFADESTVLEIINKYSYFVTVPIFLNGDHVNKSVRAIWTLNEKEITKEMHENFFRQLAKTHYPHLASDRPRYVLQYKTDSPINLRSLLYIPTHKVSQVEFATGFEESCVSLYARKVLIKANAKELLPRYLRFLVGVVDSEDIPLNLSREMLQNDAVIFKIRKVLTEHIIRFLVKEMMKNRTNYLDFYSGYSMFFKEGIVIEPDFSVKEQIAKLMLFETSNFKRGVLTSLDEYVDRMQTDQDSIYYLFSPSRQLAESSPYYELFKKQNQEVLLVSDPADELVLLVMNEFRGKKLCSVEAFIKEKGIQTEKEQNEIVRDVDKKELLEWVKRELGSIKVSEIKPIFEQSEHPFIITATNHSAMRHILRVSQPKEFEHLDSIKPILHVNFSHPVVKGLIKLHKKEQGLAKDIIDQVYDNALVTAGLIRDVSEFVPRMNKIFGQLMKDQGSSTILTP